MPMRVLLARFIQHLRRKRRSKKYVKQALTYNKWILDKVEIRRLADFNEDRIDRALGLVADSGVAARTINAYREVAHALGDWTLRVARITDRNPVATIAKRDEAGDKRKTRRSLSIDEARRLLNAAGPCQLFYAVQLWTGLRVGEVRALQWRDFHLDGDRPRVRLRAETTKSKRGDELPLHPDLVDALVNAKPSVAQPTDCVFGTTPILRTFKRDLVRAGIPFEDQQGRTVDRHALRTTFISWLGQYGVDPRAQLVLARHAPQGVTLKNYQDFGVFDLWKEIRKLPGIHESGPQTAKKTGTYDVQGVVPEVVPAGGISQLRVATSDTHTETRRNQRNDVSACADRSKHRLAPCGRLGDGRLELPTSCVSSRRSGQLS